MGGAIRFDGQASQQQTQNDTENQLFLFRQAVHLPNIVEDEMNGNNASLFTIYDMRITRQTVCVCDS
jgi:hypothetical protein